MSRKNNPKPRSKNLQMINLLREFISKLDTTWGRLAVIGLFVFAGYKIGRVHEEMIKTKSNNEIENKYNNEVLNLKDKYINENIVLNRKINELENQLNQLKIKNGQGKTR